MLVTTPEVLPCAKRREKSEGRLQKVANGCRGARGGESDAAGSILLRANSYLQSSHFFVKYFICSSIKASQGK